MFLSTISSSSSRLHPPVERWNRNLLSNKHSDASLSVDTKNPTRKPAIRSRVSIPTKPHCGVLEFDAEEGFIHVPEWMMRNPNLRLGASVSLRSVSLSRGSHMKLQPHTTSFMEQTDPKAVTMRGFSCLSRGDTIMVRHGCRDFYLDALNVGPGDAISLIDCDCHLDFAPPLDYLEMSRKRRKTLEGVKVEKVVDHGDKVEEGKVFRPFMGRGQRLNGEAVVERSEGNKSQKDGGKESSKRYYGI